ncbi:hypothetical protein GO988_08590 [Hymenobacter sp. HMF4947]|uniref:Glycosyltransferase RgtA/B/C/D-like domain-containing protein n=1 Tax=Hymenobacter ginkgonis TaxID=2682976 RepID=A0A7K1TDA8_9BACT|nr:hypothetical protein [Hymenobacter ginkgonis]MVN76380.1 hypothetical protein [Hymenobacter ginkgonis]
MPAAPSLPSNTLAGRGLLLAGLAYTALFFWYSWPLGREWSTAFVGTPHGDANQYIWNVWNFQRQVAAGHNPFYTPALLYPQGTGLWLHTYTPVLGVLNVGLRQEFWAVNGGLLLSFVLSGVGAARLAGRWVRQPLLCGLVGFVFAFSPYKLAHWPEHYHLLLTATVPFYLLAYLDALAFEPGRWLPQVRSWPLVGWGVFLLLITLFSDYYTLAGLVYFSAGYAAWWGLRLGAIDWRHWRPWAGVVVVLALGHFVSRGLALLGLDDNAGVWWGGDLAGYLVPPLGNRWLATPGTDALWRSTHFHAPGSVENVTFLGYLLPLLAVALGVGAWRQRRSGIALPPTSAETRPFWALVLLFAALTMPELRWLGHDLLRLPTSVVHFVPFLNNIRCPTRHVLLLSLLLPLAVCLRLDSWLRRWSGRGSWAVAGALYLGVFIEYQVYSYPFIRAADVPMAYRVAAALPGPVLFPIPFGLLDGYHQLGHMDAAELFYQTQHHKALPGAYISRVPAATFAAFAHEPVLRALLTVQQHPDSLALVPMPTASQLVAFERRYPQAVFVVQPTFRAQPVHELLRSWLLPAGYTEQLVPSVEGNYVLLKPAAR